MTEPLIIEDVLGRSEQGITRPFLCRGNDDAFYYVKGRYAGLHSLCCEWIGSNLAREMGLLIPAFAIAEVPEDVIKSSKRSDIVDLGTGLVFASRKLTKAREVTWDEAVTGDPHTQASILHFDWWVHNEDRSLSNQGGNPNLLVSQRSGSSPQIWAFDFNLTFDERFSEERFWSHHLFAALLPEWPESFREATERRMQTAIGKIGDLFAGLPVEWQYIDSDESLTPQLNQKSVIETLERAFTDPESFWKRP